MVCHGSLLLASFLFSLLLLEIVNIKTSEYKNIPSKEPTTDPTRLIVNFPLVGTLSHNSLDFEGTLTNLVIS